MKFARIVLLTVGLISLLINGKAQTVDEIIDKYINALGGKDKISNMKTLYFESELNIAGKLAPSVTYILDGKGYKNEVNFNEQQVVTCYTDKKGWTLNPLAGQVVPVSVPDDQLKIGQMQLDLKGPLFDYAAKGNKVELLGKENFNGTVVYKLKLTTRTNTELVLLIDSNTYYLLKTTVKLTINGQDAESTYVNSNYRRTAYGLLFPFTQEISFPGLTLTSNTEKVEINKEIEPAIFEMPKN
jgi:outer membrane lipoprotein-sorting protein